MPSTRSKSLCAALAGCTTVLLLSFSAAAGADGIGMIRTTSGDVQIERAGQRLPASVGLAVYQTDRIVTGKNGAVGVTFADEATLSAGPNSVLVLDQFRFDPKTGLGNFDVSLRRGTLSAIAGRLVEQSPGSMHVRTPAALLAVRGTEFVAKVEVSGR